MATPIGKETTKTEYPISTPSSTISGSTVPLVTDNPEEIIPIVNKYIDAIKEQYNPDEEDIVIKVTEEEEEDKGWFSHFNGEGGLNLDKGFWGLRIKGEPKRIKRVKEKTIRMGIKKKDK